PRANAAVSPARRAVAAGGRASAAPGTPGESDPGAGGRMTDPFVYPSGPHQRRHGPRGYADYESYRPWLRDEFAFRCVYCLIRETWGPLKGVYALDHFLPIASRPDLTLEYDNLLYGCVSCNLSKGS